MSEAAGTQIGAIEQTATDAVGENRRSLEQKLDTIRRDADLSESAKERLATEATHQAEERHSEIVAEYEASTSQVLEQNERRVFSLSYPEDAVTDSQREAFRSAYRDASFRLLDLSEDTLGRVMTRAERTADRALEQAVYHTAVESGFFEIADGYRDRHPEAKRAWETYAKGRMQAESNEALLGRALLSSANPGAA